MYRLDRFNRKHVYLKDVIPYARIVGDPAIVLNKDGSIQTTFAYRGPDLGSAIKEQLAIITQQLNAAIMALDRAIRCGNVSAESVYDARGLLFL